MFRDDTVRLTGRGVSHALVPEDAPVTSVLVAHAGRTAGEGAAVVEVKVGTDDIQVGLGGVDGEIHT